jgi:serine/threonine protein kinase
LNKTGNSVSIKLADFGLARRCQGSVRGGTKPVGTQTQWSPEKAEARVGYGFAAEIWAAICVLVHMLSGQPPWIRRYESYKALIIVVS